MKEKSTFIEKQIPHKIAAKKIWPENKALVVWLIINGFDLKQAVSFYPDLSAIQIRIPNFRPQKDSCPMWNFSLFYSDFVFYRSTKRKKPFDKKELEVLRKIYLKPEYAHVRYLRYRYY